ncbi:hypothetical protein Q5692_19225 [Microcoleus sp. C2C3]|uniref:hypothetical protein n=1 Tax=unclassified Microcoleus TaxID=2642155 RepID=UPI002FD4D6A7
MNKDLKRLRRKYPELIPSIPKVFYSEFDEALIRQACLEYWSIHDFNWSSYIFAQLNFTPTVAQDFLLSDFPGDMASALSTKVFEDWYKSTILIINDREEVERKIRLFCIVVCGIGKAMQLISKEMKLSSEDLFNSALVLTEIQKD